jgi:hypothetical protein
MGKFVGIITKSGACYSNPLLADCTKHNKQIQGRGNYEF